MGMVRKTWTYRTARAAQDLLWGPQLLAFLPATCLAAYWMIGEGGLIAVALLLPLVWAVAGTFISSLAPARRDASPLPQSPQQLNHRLARLMDSAAEQDHFALFALALDGADDFRTRFDASALRELQDQIRARLNSVLRTGDMVALSGPARFTIALAPGPRLDLEAAIQQASRLQDTLEEPLFLGRDRHYFTASVGFTIGAGDAKIPADLMIEQAQIALDAAAMQGASSVRAYAKSLAAPNGPFVEDTGEFDGADLSQTIIAWFQPQISTDTGRISGFEALARWQRPGTPGQGVLPPAAFLPYLEHSGQLDRLGQLMLQQGLRALQHWDANALDIATVGVNFSDQDLANPKLYDRIAWDLDRFDIAPHRLCVEVLESVVAGRADDVIARNVIRLSELGCQIDLDDFGTGHASISSLRRLPIERLKIDRSFVAKADLDPEQQHMVATILLMADRLGLSCLAEGVETLGEHAILAQLGCRYVQGYGIAKPMPLEETAAWISDYHQRIAAAPQIGRLSG